MAELPRHFQTLRVTWVVHCDAVVVTVSGEVDIDTAGLLEKGLTAARERAWPSRAMVVDLREVRFFGAAGVTALVKADIGCQEQGVVLQIVANHRAVLRPLEIVELIETLPMAHDLRPEWARPQRTTRASRAILDAAGKVLMTSNAEKSSSAALARVSGLGRHQAAVPLIRGHFS